MQSVYYGEAVDLLLLQKPLVVGLHSGTPAGLLISGHDIPSIGTQSFGSVSNSTVGSEFLAHPTHVIIPGSWKGKKAICLLTEE